MAQMVGALRTPVRTPGRVARRGVERLGRMVRRPTTRRPRRRARRLPQLFHLPPLEQRHLDVIGLALVAVAAFLACIFYLGWAGGALGEGVAEALVLLAGEAAYLAPVAVFAVGATLVLRPMLPTVRPLKAGAVCLGAAILLGLAAETFGLGPDRPPRDGFFDPVFFRGHGGAVGEALFWLSHALLQQVGTDILVVFLFLAALLLLTGATVAGVLRATGEGMVSTTRRVRHSTGEFAALVARRSRGGRGAAGAEHRRHRDEAEHPFGAEGDRQHPAVAGERTPPEEEPSLDPPEVEPIVRATHVEVPPRDPGGGRLYGEVPDFSAPPEFAAPGAEPEEGATEPPEADARERRTAAARVAETRDLARGARERWAGAAGSAAGDDALDLYGGEETVALGGEAEVGDREPASAGGPSAADLTPQGRLRASVTENDDFVYVPPSPRFLRRSKEAAGHADTGEESRLGGQLVEALSHFGVEASVVGTVSGPHVTRYELRLAPGTKMSKVSQLKDDIAYALAATDVRILAPIPGKTAVGVEVPNRTRRIVHLGDVYQEAPSGWSPLSVWLGKDIAGKAIGTDLAKQ